jgi:hypothetical protein
MYACLAEKSEYSSDAIQIYFSNTLISGINNYMPLPFTPQLTNSTGFITDTLNWTLISGNYLATGGESYLIIGNFKDDANTATQATGFPNGWQEAYYYLDDISLIQIPPCNTAIEEQTQNSGIKIYPNPVKDALHVQSSKFKVGDEIKIFDVMGKEVLKSIINNPKSEINIDMRSFSKGIYFIKVNTSGREEIKKVIKIE